jgi:glycosyltransferase involved in cell wall biosynthesis
VIDARTRVLAIAGCLALLAVIVDLVRRRRMKEEYSVLWVLTAVVLLVMAAWYQLLGWITRQIGGVALSSTLFFMGLLFVFGMLLHFSIRVSALERRLTALVQEIGLLGASALADPPPGDEEDGGGNGDGDNGDGDGDGPAAPRVAVVIPCHDDGALVTEAVDSVCEDEPVEIVVVDDGSTDPATRATLDLLATRGIAVLRQENAGPAAARTAGLAATRAPFVYPLDADDRLDPGALGAMADALEQQPAAGFAWGDYELFGEQRGRYRSPDRWLPWTLTYVNPYPISSLFRREVLERAGGWEGGYEDWDLWLRLAGSGVEGITIDRVVYHRRLHGDGRQLPRDRRRHQALYAELRRRNAAVFEGRARLRRIERPASWKRAVYPVLFGRRAVVPLRIEAMLQRMMMRRGSGLPG